MADRGRKIIQVVKRFGLCGGMEEYVFRLAESLTSLGYNVLVLCEEKVNLPVSCEIEVIQLGIGSRKPRWYSHFQFSQKVKHWLYTEAPGNYLLHSHERISGHHITTIHSTLFNFPRKFGLPSIRKALNEKLESREINEKSAACVVPVSQVISNQITQKYPLSTSKLANPINPGINRISLQGSKKVAKDLIRIGFMGEEWKRKGLPKVIEIWRTLTKWGKHCQLVLAGFPPTEDIGLTHAEKDSALILGWLSDKSKFFSEIDILLHPAKREAYGMVIAESASLGIPFVCSNECGASTLASKGYGKAIPESASAESWAEKLISLISQAPTRKCYQRPWSQVAKEYADLYDKIKPSSHRKDSMQ
jgi:UDP-glucose:(heptosyl)LPS alpha-1,3-glucosyltransferase